MKSIKKYETIINEALRSALEYDTPEGQINEFISFFGKHIGSDRIYIFEDDEEHHVTNNTYEWCAEGITPQIKHMDGEDFINKILIDRFRAQTVLCGFNFRFGKNASWSALDMRNYLEKMGIWVRILEHLDFNGEPISSTRIRKCIADGEIEQANDMLGYNFTFESKVISGDMRGRTIGFPTLNQHLPNGLVVPKYGVYESRTFVCGKEYKSFTNIGIRPTWRLSSPLSETHIFDFSGDLYNENIRIELVRYLRGEKQFSSLDELEKQLQYDKSSII